MRALFKQFTDNKNLPQFHNDHIDVNHIQSKFHHLQLVSRWIEVQNSIHNPHDSNDESCLSSQTISKVYGL